MQTKRPDRHDEIWSGLSKWGRWEWWLRAEALGIQERLRRATSPRRRWWVYDFASHPLVIAANVLLAWPAFRHAPAALLSGMALGALAPLVIGQEA